MTELDDQLRRIVDGAASPVTADEIRNRTAAPLGITATRPAPRRTRRWLAAAAALVLVVAVATLVATRGDRDRVITKIPPESSTTTIAGLEGAVVEILDGDQLIDIAQASPRTTRTAAGIYTSGGYKPPTRTPYGLIAAAKRSDSFVTDLVLYRDGVDRPDELVAGVYAFAVNGDASKIVYVQPMPVAGQPSGVFGAGPTVLTIASLPDLTSLASITFTGFGNSKGGAVPIGWAGAHVLFNTGDGAGTRSALWRAGESTLTLIASGTVRATDPFRPQALIARINESCVGWDTVTDTGVVTAAEERGCGSVAISPSGTRFVVFDDQHVLSVRDLATNTIAWSSTLAPQPGQRRALDVRWTSEDSIAVIGSGVAGVCAVGGECRLIDLPARDSRANAPTIVERRPLPSEAATVPMPTTTRPSFQVSETPPLQDLIVAVSADALDIVDARTGRPTRRIDVMAEVRKRSTDTRLRFVEVSPDKRSAVVTTTPDTDSRYSLWSVELVTGEVGLIREGALWPAYSPDGTKLAYVLTDGPETGGHTIMIHDLQTGIRRELSRPVEPPGAVKIRAVVWAPDNRTLAYSYGFYGADTLLVDTVTATDLVSDRVLPDVSPIAWPEPGTMVVHHFCCAEAEPATPARYVVATGQRFPLRWPGTLGVADLNEQDGRLLGRVPDASDQREVMGYRAADDRFVLLDERYLSASW